MRKDEKCRVVKVVKSEADLVIEQKEIVSQNGGE